eukprot:403361529
MKEHDSVFCIELIDFQSLLDVGVNQNQQKQLGATNTVRNFPGLNVSEINPDTSITQNQQNALSNNSNNALLYVDFVLDFEEPSGLSDSLKFNKKAFIAKYLGLQPDYDTITKDLVFTYQCDKGIFKGLLESHIVNDLTPVSTLQAKEFEIELRDMSEVPQYKMRVRISAFYSNIEKQYALKAINLTSQTSYIMSFSNVEIQDAFQLAARARSIQENEIEKSELYLILEIENQRYEFDIENPSGQNRKNPDNNFLFYKNSNDIKVTLEERIYKLERDDAAFLQSIRQINTKQATSINKFLMDKTGGYGNIGEVQNFDDLFTKKKILKGQPIVKLQKVISIEQKFISEYRKFQENQPFQIILEFDKFMSDKEQVNKPNPLFGQSIIIKGNLQLNLNQFTQMPRGQLKLDIAGYSRFSKDENIEFTDLVFKIQKQIDNNRDRILYIFNQKQLLNPNERPTIRFDTQYFDDQIKLDIFHKGSSIKNNMVGKGILNLKDISFDQDSIIPVEIYNKKISRITGILYVKVFYSPMDQDIYEDDWILNLQNVKQIDKYKYFDSYINSEFKTFCHFGFIEAELLSVDIPQSKYAFESSSTIQKIQSSQNQISHLYMIKIKEGLHMTQIVVASPNKILDINRSKFSTQTQSLEEKISIEFYQILSEEAFNPEIKMNFKNMRLISHMILPLRNIPFNTISNTANNYQILTNLGKTGQVANLNFKFKYTSLVPQRCLDPNTYRTQQQGLSGFLFLELVQSEQFANHHQKDLDKYTFSLEVMNETKGQSFVKRLFFNKQYFSIGFIDIKQGESLKFRFFVNKIGDEAKNQELIQEYNYIVNETGIQGQNEDGTLEQVELGPWKPVQKPFILNYDGLPKISKMLQGGGKTLLTDNTAQQKQMKKYTQQSQIFGNQTQGFKMTLQGIESNSNMILEGVMFEMELRTSDFQIMSSQNRLEAGLIQIYFGRDNILDILLAKDLTENAQFEISNASSDRRALRETKSFYLNEIDFESPFILRTFTINDAIQIKIKDIQETYASIRLSEQPLSLMNYNQITKETQIEQVLNFIQVGSKQMKIILSLAEDPALMPSSGQNGPQGVGNKLFGNILGEIKNAQALQKESSEYNKKLRELAGKSAAEQIRQLKIFINENENKNKQLITKQLKLQKDYEKSLKTIQEAKNAKPLAPKPNIPPSQTKEFLDVNKMFSGLAVTQGDKAKTAQKSETINICACGNRDPRHKGYCTDCLRKLKETFDRYLAKFNKLSEEYDAFTGIDQSKAEEKIRLMKNKIEQYEIKLNDNDVLDVIEKHQYLAKSDENRAFAEFKVQVQSMKQEIDITKVKQDIDLQDLRKQQDYIEMQVAKKLGQKKDLDREIITLKESFDEMARQADDIDKRIILKKRYVLHQAQKSSNNNGE